MSFQNQAAWQQAFKFHLLHWRELWPIFPLLCVPVLTDALHSLLIKQFYEDNRLLPGKTAIAALKALPGLLGMKLYFESAAVLWAFIPVYGLFKDIHYRLCWAMASNVLVFEGLSGESGRARCRELAQAATASSRTRTLVTVPSLLMLGCLLIWIMSTVFLVSPFAFWLCFGMIYWIAFPWSAAVNTFVYLQIKK